MNGFICCFSLYIVARRPKILGLTAALFRKRCKPREVHGIIKQLSETMGCVVRIPSDIQTVYRYLESSLFRSLAILFHLNKLLDETLWGRLSTRWLWHGIGSCCKRVEYTGTKFTTVLSVGCPEFSTALSSGWTVESIHRPEYGQNWYIKRRD